jgi:hypothetical protein
MSGIGFNIGRTNFFQGAIERLPGVSRTGLRISSAPGITITVTDAKSRDFVDSLIADSIDNQAVRYEIDPRWPAKSPGGGIDPGKEEDVVAALERVNQSGVGVIKNPETLDIGVTDPRQGELLGALLEDKILGAPVRIVQHEVEAS